jgi:hypothetical protein
MTMIDMRSAGWPTVPGRACGRYPKEGQQYVGIDLSRRSVDVRMTDAGRLLEAVQIINSRWGWPK